jgi:hypothetical protein
MIQLSDYEMGKYGLYISADELDYSAQSDLEGVNHCFLPATFSGCGYFFSSSTTTR